MKLWEKQGGGVPQSALRTQCLNYYGGALLRLGRRNDAATVYAGIGYFNIFLHYDPEVLREVCRQETIRLENLKKGVHVMIAYPGFTSSEIRYHALTADGSSQGNTPRNESEMTSSEEAAARILKGIRLRTQYQVTFTDLVVYFAKFLHKRLLNRVVYNMMAKEPDAPTNEQ